MAMHGRNAVCNTTLHLPLGAQAPNLLAVGASGAGKTQKIILPAYDAAAARGFSCIVINCKGKKSTRVLTEIARQHKREASVLAFRDPTRSLAWNPLKEVVSMGDARDVAVCLAQARAAGDEGRSDWSDNQATEWITSAIHAIATDSAIHEQHLTHLRQLVLSGTFKRFAEAHPHHPALAKFGRYVDSGNQNAQTVFASIGEQLLFLDDDDLAAVLSTDELRLRQFAKQGGILIVEINEADLDTLRPLTSLFVRRLFAALLQEAADSPTGRLGKRCFIFIDELAAAGRVPSLKVLLNTCRERGISVVAGTQSLAQIIDVYGNAAGSIVAGFQSQIALPGALDSTSAEYFSRKTGQMSVKAFTYQEGYDELTEVSHAEARSWSPVERPVLLPSEIARPAHNPLLGMPATVFLGTGTPPFHAYFPPAHTIGHLARAMERAEASPDAGRRPWPLAVPSSSNTGGAPSTATPVITDTRGWTKEQIRRKYREVIPKVGWNEITGSVRAWWTEFEKQHADDPKVPLRVAEELLKRKATLVDIREAYLQTSCDPIELNLSYLDYLLKRREVEAKLSDLARVETEGRHARGEFRTGDLVPAPGGRFKVIAPLDATMRFSGGHSHVREFKTGEKFPQYGGVGVVWEPLDFIKPGHQHGNV